MCRSLEGQYAARASSPAGGLARLSRGIWAADRLKPKFRTALLTARQSRFYDC